MERSLAPLVALLLAASTAAQALSLPVVPSGANAVAGAAAPNTGGRLAGSVLVFPVQRSGSNFFTVVSVTNISYTPMTKTDLGGSTNLHYEYVNVTPDKKKPFCPKACSIFNRIEFLTPADTLSVLTNCHNVTTSSGTEGYLVVSAEDPSVYRTRWSHNWLIGSELVVNGSGSVYTVNAIPFQSPVELGKATDLNSNTLIDFDGKEYTEIPDLLYIDSFIALANSHLTLINLTGQPLDTNRVSLSVWNDNEFPLSATLEFKCWFDQPLEKVAPLFADAFLRKVPNDSTELDVTCNGKQDLETGWAIIDSIGVRNHAGTLIDKDGAMLGALTAGPASFPGGRLLWESEATQANGTFTR